MSFFVYCTRKSDGARELTQALEGRRLRRFDGMDFWDKNKRIRIQPEDVIVCWGSSLPEIDSVRILNGGPIPSKYNEVMKLAAAGVPTVRVYNRRTNPGAGWIARDINHVGGTDLLSGRAAGDFWVFKENFVREYRVHSFAERSIKAGVKVVRDGFRLVDDPAQWRPNAHLAHPWVRSFDGGWRIRYDGFKSTQNLRSRAHSAVKALGLTFGAVDIGEKADGTLTVFEVNRAPGIEGGTTEAYVAAIKGWAANEAGGTRKRRRKQEQPPENL